MAFKSLIGISLFFIMLGETAAASYSDPVAWAELKDGERGIWENYLVQQFPSDDSPPEAYDFYRSLAIEAATEGVECPPALERVLELELSQSILLHDWFNSTDDPDTATLQTWVSKHPKLFETTESVELLSIHVRKLDLETTETVKARADEALQRLSNGLSFADVALQYSDSRSAGRGGIVGTVYRGSISPRLESLIFSSSIGETIGPVPSSDGFHIFRIRNKRLPFSLENTEDAKRALELWKRTEVSRKADQLPGEWESKTSVSVAAVPDDVSNWMKSPWINHDNLSEPFALAFHSAFRRDLDIGQQTTWSEFWAEETASQVAGIRLGLACRNLVDAQQLSASLSMALPLEAGALHLRNWYQQLAPTEQQLREFYNQESASLFPPLPIYSYLQFTVPVSPTVNDREEHAQEISNLLNGLYRYTYSKTPKSVEEAKEIFSSLSATYPGARQTSNTRVQADSPYTEAALHRTEEGALSRPFDNGNSVALIYMVEKTTDVATFDRVRAATLHAWKLKQFRDKAGRFR